MQNIVAISLDMDWAASEVVEYALSFLHQYKIKATLFMTNKIDSSILFGQHELAIHPDFTTFNLEKHFIDSLNNYPKAKGVRSHSFFFSERLSPIYKKYKIKYESNVMMYKQKNIYPYYISPTTLEIPLYFMDFFYMEMEERNTSFRIDDLDLVSPGIKVFDFHPIHIFLNTSSLLIYDRAKKYYHRPEVLIKYRNSNSLGIKDLYIELLEYINKNRIKTQTLLEIVRAAKNEK